MPLHLGFIGCGSLAAPHFAALSQIEDARPVAFYDEDAGRAQAAARRFGGKSYPSPAAMLERETLDAVYVCLPPQSHGEAETLAARAGCALFVEPPLAASLKVAEKVAQSLEDAKVLAVVGYQWRYGEATLRLQKRLGAKGAPPPAMLGAQWLGENSEGITHVLDAARLLMGEARRVSCVAAPSASCLLLEFASGAIGHASAFTLPGSMSDAGVTLHARDTAYELSGNTLTLRQPGETHTFVGANNAHLDASRAFVQAVKTGRRAGLKSPYADALKTLRLTLAAQQSAKTGRPVVL